MTRSQAYAFELSKERKHPIVLFDEAEVALAMEDPSLFPRLPPAPMRGWNLVKTLTFDRMSADEIDAQLLIMVTQSATTYGFALVGGEAGTLQIGVFEMVPEDVEIEEIPFSGKVRLPLQL